MSDNFVFIVISLLTLVVMCGLVLMAVVWVPGRVDRLDDRMTRIDELGAQLDRIQTQIDKLGTLEEKLSNTTRAIAPLARVDQTQDAIVQKLDQSVIPNINDIKGRVASKSDVDRVAAEVKRVADASKPVEDPASKQLAAQVTALKAQLDEVQKSLSGLDGLGKDVKTLSLQVQKLEAVMKKPVSP